MKTLRLLLPFAMLVLAACGGAGATSAPTGGAGTAPAATSGGAATQPPAATSGAGAMDWCLNLALEVETALGVTGVTGVSTDAPGVGGGCFYSDSAGAPVYAISVVNNSAARSTFDAAKTQPGAVEIGGIGDGAVLVSAVGPLVVLKGDAFASLGPLGPAELMSDAAAFRAAAEQLGAAAAGRM